MWANNMLFSYHENGKLKDLKFVDFQLVKYSSPAVDLHYFIATSPANEVRDKIDQLLDTYYSQLLSTLAALKYPLSDVPTMKEFKCDFEARAFYGVMASAVVTPLVKASQRKDATFDDLAHNEGPGSFREHCYTNETYKNVLKHTLPFYDSLGVLD
ncbi:PREDICTED: uncharacterized protein LOC108563020 [Nicrophorus vespilloides]|uniref:Uncharacterized protein LOC108563020 n=1 Tax=Nicrophorus vespilloides TaxID=110193 RepID=A0ABM1MR50_NICVS|nr:PREDICTED: uncharacterized protein LOC108563020 [Nicrophorus vespilloides]